MRRDLRCENDVRPVKEHVVCKARTERNTSSGKVNVARMIETTLFPGGCLYDCFRIFLGAFACVPLFLFLGSSSDALPRIADASQPKSLYVMKGSEDERRRSR